jgi:adenine-specific DNA-methyltransferase
MLDSRIEGERLTIQRKIDQQKTQRERNKLGQFATPPDLAKEILEFVKAILPANKSISFLDPAIGTGSFYSALLDVFDRSQITKASGYEIDMLYGSEAARLWKDENLELHLADFTQSLPPDKDEQKWNLVVCNPPYVRHHHLFRSEKQRLQFLGERSTGIKLSEQAGLYAHFLFIAHSWMANDGVAVWLIPAEFMDVNYGKKIRDYLLTKVSLLRVHRFASDSLQFEDALVSSAIVCFKKAIPADNHLVEFTYGGTLSKPETTKKLTIRALSGANKWNKSLRPVDSIEVIAPANTPNNIISKRLVSEKDHLRLKGFFDVKRGAATGANDYFVLTEEQVLLYRIPLEFVIPVLPAPRYLKEDKILADENGYPQVKTKLFLLSCDLPEDKIKSSYPFLWKYLQMGVEKGINQGYLCKNRKLWYQQEKRSDCRFLFAYMGRQNSEKNSPFRFLLNYSNATVTNAYHILYPKPFLNQLIKDNPEMVALLFQELKKISLESLIGEGRVYGGGLHKIEPGELTNVPATNLQRILREYIKGAGKDYETKREKFVALTLWD